MKVVIAAWHLSNPNVGLGRYSRGLIEAIARMDDGNQYDILTPVPGGAFPQSPNVRYRLIRFPVGRRRLWEQLAPLCVGRYDVLHFPYDSAVAWKRGRFVATVHDAKPLLFPMARRSFNLHRLVEGAFIRDRWAQMDHVVTDSEASRRDLMKLVGLRADRITVVYPGIDLDRFRPAMPSGAASGGTARPYILSVGGADPTKNLETLIDSFARLPRSLRENHDLVLAGDFRRRPELTERAKAQGIDQRTILTGVVDDRRLLALYQQATLFVFPSRYEGFGFPVLEAMACGCPVICSNTSSLPEVAGSTAIQVDPADIDGLSRDMARVLTDGELRRELRERGLRQAALFPWERTARETITVYERVAKA